VRDKRVDGIIFGPTGENGVQIAQIVGNIPLVMIDRRLDEVPAAAVIADNEGGAYRAACAMIERGYHHLGIVAWLPPMETLTHRVAGIHRALAEHSIPSESAPIIRVARIEPKEVRRVVREWLTEHLDAGDAPTALFALNNQLGLGTLRALRDLNLAIPDEMGLMVFDDLEFFEVTLPPISAVALPARQMGKRAMQHLLDRLEKPGGDHLHEVTVLPTEVRLRQSI
jgi:LacI family transcriptional regulator